MGGVMVTLPPLLPLMLMESLGCSGALKIITPLAIRLPWPVIEKPPPSM